jgi:hypothetical protein
MRKPYRRALAAGIAASALLAVAIVPQRAQAFPAFARKTGMSCSACHVGWPIFNQEGQNFRDNGYQFNLGKDDPVFVSPDFFPIAFRSVVAYQFTRLSNQESDAGAITTKTGGVALPELDILTGGVIAKDVSFLVVVSGFGADGTASLESAWARLDNIAKTSWLNFRIGKFELDQPASSHRNVTLTTNYAVYSAHPEGSVVTFDYAENHVGIELDGHDARSATRYSLSLISADAGQNLSSNGWSAPLVYGHVQRALELPSLVLPWVRVGALGGVGWWPTQFDTLGGAPVPGTGRDHRKFYRAGADLSWLMGHPSTPLLFQVAYIHGREEAGLAGDGSASNSFNGGFAEVDWVPWSISSYDAIPWMFFGRYDLVRFQHGVGDFDGGTIGARRYLALGPRASAAIHIEGHIERGKGLGFGAGGPPPNVTTKAALAGIDFDY